MPHKCNGKDCDSTDTEMRYDAYGIPTGSWCKSCYNDDSKYTYRRDLYFDPGFAGEHLEAEEY